MFSLSKKSCFLPYARRKIRYVRATPTLVPMCDALANATHDAATLQKFFFSGARTLSILHAHGIFHNNMCDLRFIFIHPFQKKIAMIDFEHEADMSQHHLAFEQTDFGAFLTAFGAHASKSSFCASIQTLKEYAADLYEKGELCVDQMLVSRDCTFITFCGLDRAKETKIQLVYDKNKHTCKKLL